MCDLHTSSRKWIIVFAINFHISCKSLFKIGQCSLNGMSISYAQFGIFSMIILIYLMIYIGGNFTSILSVKVLI